MQEAAYQQATHLACINRSVKVADLKKMINWKKVKADGVTPTRQKELLVFWDLLQGRPEPTP